MTTKELKTREDKITKRYPLVPEEVVESIRASVSELCASVNAKDEQYLTNFEIDLAEQASMIEHWKRHGF